MVKSKEKNLSEKKQWNQPKCTTITESELKEYIKVAARSDVGEICRRLFR